MGGACYHDYHYCCHTPTETVAGWFRAIGDGENGDTYVKMSADTLARTCEAVEREECDGDEALCVQNLVSTAGYVHTALVSVGGACCEYGWSLL